MTPKLLLKNLALTWYIIVYTYRLIISCLFGNPSLKEGEYINGVSVSFLFDQEAITVPRSANGSPNVQSSQSTIAATRLLFTLTLSNL